MRQLMRALTIFQIFDEFSRRKNMISLGYHGISLDFPHFQDSVGINQAIILKGTTMIMSFDYATYLKVLDSSHKHGS